MKHWKINVNQNCNLLDITINDDPIEPSQHILRNDIIKLEQISAITNRYCADPIKKRCELDSIIEINLMSGVRYTYTEWLFDSIIQMSLFYYVLREKWEQYLAKQNERRPTSSNAVSYNLAEEERKFIQVKELESITDEMWKLFAKLAGLCKECNKKTKDKLV